MAVRNSTARTSSNKLTLTFGGVHITLMARDWTTPKSYLYSIKKKILNGKVTPPSLQEKTGANPFLLGYCSKDIKNGVEFVWN